MKKTLFLAVTALLTLSSAQDSKYLKVNDLQYQKRQRHG